ncbi:MAG: L-glutamate gamma-semialdehyde dehydrogenase [Acidobacteriia bacterium]|nr:L-glutamate gamma-semialdehyde dehydrogenase [Terriglobia bacterium]
MLHPFKNQTFIDFSIEKNVAAMNTTLAAVEKQFCQKYPLVIGGERYETGDLLPTINPAQTDQVLGSFHRADEKLADKAIAAAWKAFASWSKVSARDRAEYLLAAAAEMRRRKMEFMSWMVFEAGKSWFEADADVSEAIDFLEFYAREAIRYGELQPLTPSPLPDEVNEAFFIPLGVGIVIPPWNFPLAIMAGMTSAAIAAGNCVVLKPSSESPLIAYRFFELMESLSLPPGVINFLPASGGKTGDFLVSHPQTRFIAFTGSKAVGLHINELAAKTAPGQKWIKRVVAEMGGKDTIIVDASADLDSAADGVVASAFGYQGQKCSACSRLVAEEKIYDRLLEKIVERCRKITVGPTREQKNTMGPVISRSAYESILNYIEIGKKEGKLITGGGKDEKAGNGFFIQPTIIGGVDPKARISCEEIFGPVLAVVRARDFSQLMEIANNTEYGLTGSIYSRNRAHIEQARRDFHVGNLYINRKCTGALVDVHPFGGFNMSGTDSKAGGREYLLLFLQSKAVAEKF